MHLLRYLREDLPARSDWDSSIFVPDFCWQRGIEVVGSIPHDSAVTEAMVAGKPVIEFSEGRVSDAIKNVWEGIK